MRLNHIAAVLLTLSLAAGAQAADKSVAVVNGVAIAQTELDQLTDSVVKGSNGRVKDSPELRAELKQQLINRQIILQEAGRRSLDKSAQFKERLEDIRNDLLQQALFEDIARANPVTDALVRSEDGRGRQPNPAFLNPELATQEFVQPALDGLRHKTGALVFQLSPLPLRELDRLHDVLERLRAMPSRR